MHHCSNLNHDKFKKKAVEEEVDVSTLLCVLALRPHHLTLGQDEVYFRVNFNRFDVFIRNNVRNILRPLLLVVYSTGIACGSSSIATI